MPRGQDHEARHTARQERGRALVEELEPWLRAKLTTISQKTKLAEASRYALSRWAGLTLLLEDGRTELDNNIVERSIRPLALTRKNSLFAGSDGGAEHWAILASLIETAKLNAVDRPFKAVAWKGRVIELVARRARVFERIAPFKRASDAYRHRSRFLEGDSARLVTALRAALIRELPAEMARDAAKVEILDLLLSWESWSRLRREQGLSVKSARETLEAAVVRIVG